MKIDCSKISNKDDLVCLIGIFVIFFLLGTAIALAINYDNFISGFFSATIAWKWRDWVYTPIDNVIDKLWPEDKAL